MSEAAEEAKREFAKQAVALIFMVIALAIMAAVHDPDFIRTQRMKMANSSRRLLDTLARRFARISMGTELRTGQQEYSIPYRLSLMRDRAAEMYDKAKEH